MTLPKSLTSIGEQAFLGCENLEDFKIPASVTSIGSLAFCTCPKLTAMEIPEGITVISDNLFAGCRGLKSVKLPSTITSIQVAAFENCSALTDIVIPEGVTHIGHYALNACSSIKKFRLPSTLQEIGYQVFGENENIEEIHVAAPQPPVCTIGPNGEKEAADQVLSNAILYVPKGCIKNYALSEGWMDFKNIKEEMLTGIDGLEGAKMVCTVSGKNILISHYTGPLDIYSLGGELLKSMNVKGNATITLNYSGAILLKAKTQVLKLSL